MDDFLTTLKEHLKDYGALDLLVVLDDVTGNIETEDLIERYDDLIEKHANEIADYIGFGD